MPELPEIETIKRDLESLIVGKKITRVEIVPDPKGFRSLRDFPSQQAFVREVEGRIITKVGRRGKYLLFELDTGDSLIIHLGMNGQLLYRACDTHREDFTRVAFILDGDELRFTDVRKLGRLYLYSPGRYEHVDVSTLGPEPLSDAFNQGYLAKILSKRKKAIKPVLMDQALVAGIGNIYSDEILFEARIHPKRPASSLDTGEVARLHRATQAVLKKAIQSRGTSARDDRFVDALGRQGNFQAQLKVYQRTEQPCFVCGQPISRIKLGGRSSHFCSHCQK